MITAAILAGGRATRLGGRDKSGLVVGGRTIFDRQMSELSQIADEILFVGATGSPPPPSLPETPAPHPGVTMIADLIPGCGPLGGLHAALTAARGEVLLVVACDMPYVSARLLAHLASLAGGPGEFVAVVPKTERGYHPLCAAYTRAAIEPIRRRLAAGRLTMTDLLMDVKLRVVTAEEIANFGDPHRLLANVNTPAEYRSLEALHNHEV
jgi:molybdopterin-guanine dinucleotide biosynthesis protein A